MKQETKYKKALEELKGEFDTLMYTYLQKLHNAFHEDNSLEGSHEVIVIKIRQDFMSIFSIKLGSIAFDDRSEEEVIKEILEYNFDLPDVEYIKEVEGVDLCPFVNQLNEYCLKRTDPEWFQFGIHELIQNGKVIPGTVGSKRTQFCKYCGERVYLGQDTHASRHTKRKKLG